MRESGYIVRPEHFLRYLRKDLHLTVAQTRLPRRAVHVFGGDEFRDVRRAIHGTPSSWSRWVAVGKAGRVPAAVFRSHIGAPASCMDLEEMGVLGVREVIAFGSCGSIVPDLRIGDIVVPSFAVSDEGTSRHYDAPRRPEPDPSLRKGILAACATRGLAVREGGVWTTDAPYREHRDRASRLAKRGVVAVDMESSALWTVARHRGMRVASVFVVSDELTGPGWKPGFHHERHLEGLRGAARLVVETLARRNR